MARHKTKKNAQHNHILRKALQLRLEKVLSLPLNTREELEIAVAMLENPIQHFGKALHISEINTEISSDYLLQLARLKEQLLTLTEESPTTPHSLEEPTEPVQQNANPQLIVPKNSQFFIAIGSKKQKALPIDHNFVFLGYMQNGVPTLLARVGKTTATDNSPNTAAFILKAIFYSANATLESEPLLLKRQIGYMAFEIPMRNYLEFIKFLKRAKGELNIECYQPVDEDDQNITFELKKIEKEEGINTPDADAAIQNSKRLRVGQTCRKTAIDITEQSTNAPIGAVISRLATRRLPLSTTFENGKPKDHYYVFPLPARAYSADKYLRLNKIFKRMEKLIKIDPYNENTIKKFDALKKLYDQQAGIPQGDFKSALKSIEAWQAENQELISTFRKKTFFTRFQRKTATETMVENIKTELSNAK